MTTARSFFEALRLLGPLRVISQCGPSTFESICTVRSFSLADGYFNAIDPAFHWHLKLDGFGHLCSRDEIHARSGLDLEDLKGRSVSRLSGGERRRAWLAMALCQGARVLLLDEPTSSLDLKHQCEVLDLLAHINRERGVTLAVVLHDLERAARLAHRMAVLHRGRLYAIGAPRECLTREMFLDVFGVDTRLTDEDGTLRIRVLGPGDATRSL